MAAKQETALENSLALAYLRKPGPEGLQHAERGLELMREVLARHPGDVDIEQSVGTLLAAEAGALIDAGELEKAASNYEHSIELKYASGCCMISRWIRSFIGT